MSKRAVTGPIGPKRPILAATAILASVIVPIVLQITHTFSIRSRQSDLPDVVRPRIESEISPTNARPAFALRLVDSGGVGIPLDMGWGKDYSHDRRTFHDVILTDPPYVDPAAFARMEQDWRTYVERMLEYGNNAIAVPLFLELIDFDRADALPRANRGVPIYQPDSSFRSRHGAIRQRFGPLIEWTVRRGMRVFLDTDMLALTPPLDHDLRGVAPAQTAVGIDPANPVVWDVYRAGLEELLDELPSIEGVLIRFGEGGNLYNTEGWPYRSEKAIRSGAALRAMLQGLLPAFEARRKTLIVRSWTVGVGGLGRLHVDPRVYETVLGDIDSAALVVSTKFTAGDFFSYLPLNPTLMSGRHKRLIELQAKPEFEGFGAFPDFLGEEHANALRVLRAANPQIVGTYLLTQFGGPLRAGPRALYPLHGFWLWIDANVFVTSKLAQNPDMDVDDLARAWARKTFGDDSKVIDAVTSVLRQTRDAMLRGFYIRPFAQREVRVAGLELPPLLWIFEWDMLGGWNALLSVVYKVTSEDLQAAIDEGYASADIVRSARERLQSVFAANPDLCASTCAGALRSLEYQETLFDTLAAWRHAFLSYYRWLDRRDVERWYDWRAAGRTFELAASRHVTRFGNDLDFPAFDLTSALQAASIARSAERARMLAAVFASGTLALLVSGSVRIDARRDWRRMPQAVPASILTFVGSALLVGTLTGWTSLRACAVPSVTLAIIALAFVSTADHGASLNERARLLAAATGPFIPGLLLLFGAVAYAGPVRFWFLFWTSPIFRATLLAMMLGMLVWTASVMATVRITEGWRRMLGSLAVAAGAGLLTLAALLPDWTDVVRSLDRPLNLAPATHTMVFALQTYLGVNLNIGTPVRITAGILLAGGFGLCVTDRPLRKREAG